jgi:hypothetical protein
MKRTTWIFLGVFILVLAGFLLIQNIEKNKEAPVEDTGSTLTPVPSLRSFDDQELYAIVYKEAGEISIRLEKVDTLEWTVTTHPEGQVTAGNIEEILSYLSNMELISVLSSPPSLSDVGLDDPEKALQIEYEEGTTYTISIGTATAFTDGYYAQVDDYDTVVVLPIAYVDQVITLLNETTRPPTPTPTLPAANSEGSGTPATPMPENTD